MLPARVSATVPLCESVAEFSTLMRGQLSMTAEARALARLRANFSRGSARRQPNERDRGGWRGAAVTFLRGEQPAQSA